MKIHLGILLLLSSCTRVEPGYVGIKVNQWGSQRGVEDFPILTGRVTYNPFTTDVYAFPTFRQNVVWDERGEDESVTFNSVEGAVINADVGLSYSIEAEKVPALFVEFRQGIAEITETYVRSEVRDAIARKASTVKAVDVFGAQKQELLEAVRSDLNERLGPVGFNFEMVSFIGALRCPPDVSESINATIQATQLAISAQNKIVQATAEADQAIQTARGEAESILAVARAQAEANALVARSLTPELVQWRAIERWDGVQPTFMAGQNGMIPLVQIGASK